VWAVQLIDVSKCGCGLGVHVFLAVEFFQRLKFLYQSSVLVFQYGDSVFQTADILFLLPSAFFRRLSERHAPPSSSTTDHHQLARLVTLPHRQPAKYLKRKVKVKECHTPKEHRRDAHLPFIGRWARRWINHCCLWRMASAMPHLPLPSQPNLVLIHIPTEGWPGRVDLGGWLHTEIVYPPEDGHPSRH